MTNLVGKKNRYTCQKCNSYYITIDKDDGTTPFMAPCQVRLCDGMAQSEFYRVDQSMPATHEWYRAGDIEARSMKMHLCQHHDWGGLFLRKASVPMTLREDLEIESDLNKAVKAAREEATGMKEPPTPKRGFA